MNNEFEIKISKVRELLAGRNLDALLVERVSSFAWLTCGAASYVNIADDLGIASLLITPDHNYLITNNIEAPRLLQEEDLEKQGWEVLVTQWYSTSNVVSQLTEGLRVGMDGLYQSGEDLSFDLSRLRADLQPVEQDRLRELCRGCAKSMEEAIFSIKPGMSEYDIAAILAGESYKRGILPIVNLIATDERIYKFRHPLPTEKKMERYAMLVLCGRKYGLVASLTRLVHFGQLPDDLKQKEIAVAEIDATFIANTKPGRSLADIFKNAQKKYADTGYPEEWQLHHQGGPAGYSPRETIANESNEWIVKNNQAYAWNPSITGTKSEDTILITGDGFEILTELTDWPIIEVDVQGHSIRRPAILEIIE